MKVLFVSNLFPNCHEPFRGIFNFRQVTHLAKRCEVRVIAPIEWFFIKGKYAPPAPVPGREEIAGLPVFHPKTFYLPKIGHAVNAGFFARSVRRVVAKLRRDFDFDVIYVNWTFPDACGMARIAAKLNKPFVVSISGSDANVYLKINSLRRQIVRMLGDASAITVRSRALQKLIASHGVPTDKIHVLYNGVDRAQFTPLSCGTARQQLGLNNHERLLLYVGHLRAEKGVADLLDAIAKIRLPLVIVGDGPERVALQEKVRALGIANLVHWAGRKRPEEIAPYLNAADLLCLPSHSEGVPNVALEAFACGLPVVATAVGGTPEIMTDQTGVLAEPRDPASFAAALREALGHRWDADAIRAHAARFDWNENAKQLMHVLQTAVAR